MRLVLAMGLGCLLTPSLAAAAGKHDAITDSNYNLDLAQSSVMGSPRMIGMGGATVGLAEGSAALISNPAAAAVRTATSTGNWDWDFHLDWIIPSLGADPDNSGYKASSDLQANAITGGLIVQIGRWGFGFAANLREDLFRGDTWAAKTTAGVLSAVIAGSFWDGTVTIGVGALRTGFSLGVEGATVWDDALLNMTGTTVTAGTLVRVPGNVHVGASGWLPVVSDMSYLPSCTSTSLDLDPSMMRPCNGYILPRSVVTPWQAAAGIAWRGAATSWDRKVDTPFRDERELIFAFDLVLTGPVVSGAGTRAFLVKQMQPSGAYASLSPRGGFEYQVVPGWLRLRGGGYWEPSRFDDMDGRLHGTVGAEVRLLGFHVGSSEYRLRGAVAYDGALQYGNLALSVGFWH